MKGTTKVNIMSAIEFTNLIFLVRVFFKLFEITDVELTRNTFRMIDI